MSRGSKCLVLSRRLYRQLAMVTFAIGLVAAVARAQGSGLSIYPSNGQTPEQQAKDKYECSQWAASQSGFNPAMPAPATSMTAQQPRGQVARGAARGAAVGAVGGAIAGDAGMGAAAGAAMGGTTGAIHRPSAKRQE